MTKFISESEYEHARNIQTVSAISQVMKRFRLLGKIARKRMLHGDFTNTPPKKNIKKEK